MDDGLAPGSASDKYDPFVQWAQLGNVIDGMSIIFSHCCSIHLTGTLFDLMLITTDGVLAWIAIGVNLADQNISQPPLNPLSKKCSMIDDHLDH